MNRRDFLKSMIYGAATATATGRIVRGLVSAGAMASPFVLYGDGVTDDTAAIQALIDGCEVVHKGRVIKKVNNIVYLPAATYCINGHITARRKSEA